MSDGSDGGEAAELTEGAEVPEGADDPENAEGAEFTEGREGPDETEGAEDREGVEGIEDAEDFLGIAAHGEVGDVDEADDVLRIDDEGGALGDSGLEVEDAELLAKVALDVREHGEGQILQIGVVVAPGEVNELGVDAGAEKLRVAVEELLIELAEGGDFGGADEGEVLGPEENDFPLAGVAFVCDLLEGLFGVEIDHGGEIERGEIFADSQHEDDSFMSVFKDLNWDSGRE